MKLAAITDEISQDFAYALDVMQVYGAQGAELRGLWGTNIADLTDDQVTDAKSALQERGMQVVGLATPFYKCDLSTEPVDPEENAGPLHLATPRGLAAQMDLLRRCIRLAHTFETPYLRVFSFWRKSAYTPEIEQQIIDAFAEPLKLAEQEGVTLLLENEHSCYIGSGAETGRIVGEINSPQLKVVWDPGNAFWMGERPFPEGYEAVRRWVAHVHVKDARVVETADHGLQPEWCVVGEGAIDYVGQFAALRKEGYSGWISLETHFRPAVGSGPDGKGTAEDGSRLCLAALQKLLA